MSENSYTRLQGQLNNQSLEERSEVYLVTYFTLVKDSVQITSICHLFSIHRSYYVPKDKSAIGITFGGLQTLWKVNVHQG